MYKNIKKHLVNVPRSASEEIACTIGTESQLQSWPTMISSPQNCMPNSAGITGAFIQALLNCHAQSNSCRPAFYPFTLQFTWQNHKYSFSHKLGSDALTAPVNNDNDTLSFLKGISEIKAKVDTNYGSRDETTASPNISFQASRNSSTSADY